MNLMLYLQINRALLRLRSTIPFECLRKNQSLVTVAYLRPRPTYYCLNVLKDENGRRRRHYSWRRCGEGDDVPGDLRKFCEQQGDILQWDQSNKNYVLTHGVSGVDWRFYKHPLPYHVYDVYMQYWSDTRFL